MSNGDVKDLYDHSLPISPAPAALRAVRIAPEGHYTRFETVMIAQPGRFYTTLDKQSEQMRNLIAIVQGDDGKVLALLGVRDEQLFLDRDEWADRMEVLRRQLGDALKELADSENAHRATQRALAEERTTRSDMVTELRQHLSELEFRNEVAAADNTWMIDRFREELGAIAYDPKRDPLDRECARRLLGLERDSK